MYRRGLFIGAIVLLALPATGAVPAGDSRLHDPVVERPAVAAPVVAPVVAPVTAPVTAPVVAPVVADRGDALARVRLVIAPEGNVARYRVREQLARLDFPNDAVGETSSISGALVLDEDGSVVAAESRFEVDLRTLKSDSDRRDNYIRRRTLQTEQYPMAVFVPTAIRGAPSPLPTTGEFSFELDGELTIREVTRPVTWQVTARAIDGGYAGTATTEFTFGTFELEIPRVASVLSIRDNIRLEYDFRLVRDVAGD
ncbi:MAG: YceI family protein [Gemmatimonadota bacterium]